MRVFVKNQRGEALMPCDNRKARLLLKEGKAKIHCYNPFTIQLLYATGEAVQEVNVGVDTGAKHIGIAITSENNVLAKGEIELRDGISESLKSRKDARKHRRKMKTRYRPARLENRTRKDGWLPPSVQSKIDATFMWIDRFTKLVPNPKLSIEVGKFDVAKMINPDIEGVGYQDGNTKGYYDVRYFVFARDNYTCQVCKKKNKILRTHHILYETHGGTNRADNLITVCTNCHTSQNHKPNGVLYKWMQNKKKVKQYKEPTFMNIVRRRTFKKYSDAQFTYGSETTPKRKEMGLEKTHYNDAVVISGISQINENVSDYFYYKQFRKKKRSLHETIPRKGLKHKNVNAVRNNKNVKYRRGIYLNDKVNFNGEMGWVYGFAGGEKYGKDCVVKNIKEEMFRNPKRKNAIQISCNDFKVLCHNNGWQYTQRRI